LPSKTLTYSYYPNGARKQTQTPVGTFSYNYDAAGRIVGLTNPFGETTAWDYLSNDWLWKQRQTSGITVNGTPTELERIYTYNALGQMTGLANGLGGAAISIFDGITHDGAGNRTSVTSALSNAANLGGTTTWAYDNKNRLTGESSTRNGGWSAAFGYDGAGNLTTFKGLSRTYNANNQLRYGTNLSASYYDGNGNPTAYKNAAFLSYDPENNLTKHQEGGSGPFGTIVMAYYRDYGYTSGGLRAWKQGAGGRTYFLYDGVAPVVEMNSSGATLATNTFGPAGLISRKDTSSTTGSTFYAFDERGNTAQRVSSGGALISKHIYDAYGVAQNSFSGNPNSDSFLFGGQAGYYTDGETGLVLCTFRYYDPSVGRWLTRDPAGYGGGMNLYAYCYGNPTNALDPLGLNSEELKAAQATTWKTPKPQQPHSYMQYGICPSETESTLPP
jgi:RHS repeat-associated protein